jgi:hypothetical protein
MLDATAVLAANSSEGILRLGKKRPESGDIDPD